MTDLDYGRQLARPKYRNIHPPFVYINELGDRAILTFIERVQTLLSQVVRERSGLGDNSLRSATVHEKVWYDKGLQARERTEL